MQLPPALRQAIEQELTHCDGAKLRAASARLTECYRQSGAPETLSSSASGALSYDEQRAAYLAVRVPATFAAVVAALTWAREKFSGEIRTVLDLGSGPGTALWAAQQVFPTLVAATAVERDSKLIEIARRLSACAPNDASHSALRQTAWLQGDLTTNIPTASAPDAAWDLVVCSYTLNELPEAQRSEFIRHAWARTGKLLVVVEPGTKTGFANILAVRTRLLAQGATVVAPCPNSLACPMACGGDWCHFAARVERTAEHRRVKNATLGHEDEKFSYVAFSRGAEDGETQPAGARIVRHPKIFSGYTQLTLCREGEIAATTITRSKKEDWRRLKRLGWGDRW
jgi:ribosomal protein RSM22 (predicted rRNA methylase)